jgi:tetratricopeptide (TPR) repeat protein
MLAWILLIASFAALFLMFVRRLRLTRQDIGFQDNLAEEEAADQEAELAVEAEEMEDAPEDEPVKAKSARAAFMKADTLFSRGGLDEAEPLFLAVIEADDGHLDAHHKLGMLYMKKEDFPQAELYFSKLVNLKKDPIYFSNLGAALYQQQRLVEAAEAYENAIALDNRRAARLQSLAQVYFELGDDDKALKNFELAARKKPKDTALKMLIAEYYERLERHDEAVVMLEKILEKEPYNKEAKKMLKKLS